MRKMVFQLVGLMLVSIGLASLVNTFGPRRIPWVQDWAHHQEQQARTAGIELISLFESVRAFQENAVCFVDARPVSAFLKGHIPGATNVAPGDAPARLLLWDESRTLVIYCDGLACDDALNLCLELKANGYENMRLFADGFDMWLRFGQPQEMEEGQ